MSLKEKTNRTISCGVARHFESATPECPQRLHEHCELFVSLSFHLSRTRAVELPPRQAPATSSGCCLCRCPLLPGRYHYQPGVTTVSMTVLCFRCGAVQGLKQEQEHARRQRSVPHNYSILHPRGVHRKWACLLLLLRSICSSPKMPQLIQKLKTWFSFGFQISILGAKL